MNQKQERRSMVPNDIVIHREDFGAGKLGEHCYQLVKLGMVCDAMVGPNEERCGNRAIGTTDFDVLGTPETLGHCSIEHHLAIRYRVEADLARIGRTTSVSRNGWGRSIG